MSEPLPISVLLLARDESRHLEELLPTLDFARDMVVVVDAASLDSSADVAQRAGARVFVRPLEGFGAQRQFALGECREDWVLWIDADERLDERAVEAIRHAVLHGSADGYRIRRTTWFLGGPIRFGGWGGDRVTRLFRRTVARFDDAPVHERVHVRGRISDLAGTIEHRSYETWEQCRSKLVRYAALGAERARREGRRAGILDVSVRPLFRFVRMYVLELGFLDGMRGVTVCGLAAAQVFLKYAELWGAARGSGSDTRKSSARPKTP